MTVPVQFPRRMSRAASVTAAAPAGVSGDPADGSPPPVAAPGIAGQVTHTGLFFVPALAALAGAAVRLWREEP
jgi:hypothetical protein